MPCSFKELVMSFAQTYRISLFIPGLFSADECERILKLTSQIEMTNATVWDGDDFSEDKEKRDNLTAFIQNDANNKWIYDRMDILFVKAAKLWGFDVDGTEEEIKYLKYNQGNHFSKWHADIGPGYANRRKLSMSILLNSREDFSGGDLEIFPNENTDDKPIAKKPGDAIVFPSFRHHRVTPVTNGERHVLINWISGPELR